MFTMVYWIRISLLCVRVLYIFQNYQELKKLVRCMYAVTFGCMYAPFGCMSMERLGAKYVVVGCNGAVGCMPDSR